MEAVITFGKKANMQNTEIIVKTPKSNTIRPNKSWVWHEYQPSGNGGARSLTAPPHCLQPLTDRLLKSGQRGLEIDQTLGYWTFRLIFANEVFWFDHSFYEKLKNPKGLPVGPKLPMGSGKRFSPRLLSAPVNFCYISFLNRALLLWEKVATEKMKKKINT